MRFSPFSVIIIFIAIMFIGLAFIPNLNVSLKPTDHYNTLQVLYSWENASPKIIEEEVSSKLEGLFNNIKGILKIESESAQGYGRIYVKIKKNTNIDAVRFEMSTIIRRSYTEFPKEVSFPVITSSYANIYKNNKPLMIYTLNANVSPYFIQDYVINNIIPIISNIKGINSVQTLGATPFIREIEYDLNKIKSVKISAEDISFAINNYFKREIIGLANINFDSFYKETLKVVLENNIPENIDWNKIPIKKIDNRIIYLGDIAKIRFKESTPNRFYRINGLNTVSIIINSEKGKNAVMLTTSVRKEIEKIKHKLPNGYKLLLIDDSSVQIKKELKKIINRIVLSLIILLLFIYLISLQYKYLIVVLLSLIANLLLAIIVYKLLNIQIHLYSLVGINISFGIIIDNTIIMIEHIQTRHDKKVFIAIIAATLTTISSLSVIFFLPEKQQINLYDFAAVIIINLSVSLIVALFFIPSLISVISLTKKNKKYSFKKKRYIVKASLFYTLIINNLNKYKFIYIIIIILFFGLPINKIPDKIHNKGNFALFYNKNFKKNIKPVLNMLLGGTSRYFTEFVKQNAQYNNPQRTTLNIFVKMPEGSTAKQVNVILKKQENFLASFNKIEKFITKITDNKSGIIKIYFKPEYELGSFPLYLKKTLIKKAVSIGGGDWNIYGIGKGFSNSISNEATTSYIKLTGYNYNRLMKYAIDIKKKLLHNSRVSIVNISGNISWHSDISHEYILIPNKNIITINDISLINIYKPISNILHNENINSYYSNKTFYPLILKSSVSHNFDMWHLKNYPLLLKNKYQKNINISSIKLTQKPNSIFKENQVFKLVLNYSFKGSGILEKKFSNKIVKKVSDNMPVGFKCVNTDSNKNNLFLLFSDNYKFLLIIIVSIFFICSILFESFKQSFAVVLMIPISFIGIFLTFIIFEFGFDQGGVASFILLSGITVNAGIYIINDYNRYGEKTVKNYVKALNYKIIPIILTISSTILGLVPFLFQSQKSIFWFSFAVGSIGGLIFSFISIFIYLPLFIFKNDEFVKPSEKYRNAV